MPDDPQDDIMGAEVRRVAKGLRMIVPVNGSRAGRGCFDFRLAGRALASQGKQV